MIGQDIDTTDIGKRIKETAQAMQGCIIVRDARYQHVTNPHRNAEFAQPTGTGQYVLIRVSCQRLVHFVVDVLDVQQHGICHLEQLVEFFDRFIGLGTIKIEGTNAEAPYVKTELPNYAVGNLRNIPDEEFAALLGHDIPNGALPFYKKNRMVIDYNTTIRELRYSKRWIGRLIGKAVPWFTRVLYKCGNRELANTLVMGVVHQPMRGMSRFSQGGLRMSQLDGLISMFNGHFFSGLHHFFKEGRKYKKLAKAEKKAQKEAETAKQIETQVTVKEEPVIKEEPIVEEKPVVQEQVVEQPKVEAQPVEAPKEESKKVSFDDVVLDVWPQLKDKE